MSREEFLALADRVEQATGPDRELDCAIRMAVYAPEGSTMEQSPINGNWCIYSGTSFRTGKPALWESHLGRNHSFTASLDAAMSLAEGCGGQVTFFKDGTAKAFLWQPYPLAIECKAATPALALCAAALKARSLTVEDSRG